ncbi:hypothetical protein [Sunxiuqinia dokdonensis]|uniref:Uncharacterized protein n=1 Tax=Sunxiuqinia dokdonensis TaxID=1409788 RepID=A0A0L8V6Y5_9BACT|nr:hypothetical protein [Sunxiuqinia dokdonensis]KOH44123.1 hypothetical protein NC99_31160 [Sunxiuqinia dokdonensis]
MTQRNYSVKDEVMLMACKTIVKNMSINLSDLSLVRSNWTEDYVAGLDTKIDTAVNDFLGLDKQKHLRAATDQVEDILKPAIRNLGFLKTQIEVDMGKDAKEILRGLGYTKPLNALDQEGVITLLYAFKKGMTDDLKAQMLAKGTNPVLIDETIGYAEALQQANLSQEVLKGSSRELSAEAATAFNDIYTEVIGICKIASRIYHDDPVKKSQFTFNKVVARMGANNKKEEEPVAE